MMREVLVEGLHDAIKRLEDVEGVRAAEQILKDMKSNILPEVTILRSERFELVFDRETKELSFKTTYSNQVIDKRYVDEIVIVNVNLIGLRFILKGLNE